jgi:hypothetical protein
MVIPAPMSENPLPETGDGVGAGVLSLFLGFPVAALFNTFVQGQDLIVLLLVLIGFGGCIVYGEVNVAMPNGLAFGIGLLMTGFVALNVWPIGLGILAASISLVKYAFAKPGVSEEPEEEDPLHPGGDSVE